MHILVTQLSYGQTSTGSLHEHYNVQGHKDVVHRLFMFLGMSTRGVIIVVMLSKTIHYLELHVVLFSSAIFALALYPNSKQH
jgi:hypothetical protein